MEGHFYILSDSVSLNHSDTFEYKYANKLSIIKENLTNNGSLFDNRVNAILKKLDIPKDLDAYLIVYLLDEMKTQDFIDLVILGEKIEINKIGTVLHEDDDILNEHVFIDCNLTGCTLISLNEKKNSLSKGLPIGEWLISIHAIPGSFVGMSFAEDQIKIGTLKSPATNYATSFLIEWSRHRYKGWDDYVIKSDFDIQFINTQNIVEC